MELAIAAAVEKLSAPQRRAWAALTVERLVRLLCGRQAGKTHLIALWLLVGAMLMAGSVNVYLSLTKESAKRNIWPELRAIGTALGFDESCFKWHGGVVTLPNGSTVLVMGTDDKTTIETWRGPKLYRVAVDEMGAQPPEWVEYLITEILWWTVMKNQGAFLLAGNPGLVCDGYWWEQTKPGAVDGHCLFSWDVFANPGIPHAAAFVTETMVKFKWSEDSPGYIRSVLGRWVRDDEAVVYPYDESRNGLDALPPANDGHVIPANSWSYTIAANVARPERIAWVVLASNRAWPGAVVIEAGAELLDPDPAALRLRSRVDAYPDADVVIDPGELGAAHVESLRRRYGLAAAVAEKDAKPSAIRDMRGAVLSGAVRVVKGAATMPLRDAWNVLGWHPRKPVHHNPAQVVQDQVAAAAAYGFRRVPVHAVDPRAHVVGSAAWDARMREHLMARAARRQGDDFGFGRLGA